MADIRQLSSVDQSLLERLIRGYISDEAYRVVKEETPDLVCFELWLIRLGQPFVKQYPLDAQMIAQYSALAEAGHAFGAFVGETCIGIALCEPRPWNNSLHVHEFHVAPNFQRKGIGRALMAAIEEHARAEGMRRLVLETQTTNAPAIRFYRALGFTLDAVDISLYGSDDLARGEVAVFMKKDVTASRADTTSILHLDE